MSLPHRFQDRDKYNRRHFPRFVSGSGSPRMMIALDCFARCPKPAAIPSKLLHFAVDTAKCFSKVYGIVTIFSPSQRWLFAISRPFALVRTVASTATFGSVWVAFSG